MFSKKPQHKKDVPFLFDRKNGQAFFLHSERSSKLAERIEGTDLFPFIQSKTERYFISGPSGSGKSTFSAGLVRVYEKRFPNNKIFMISSLQEDPAFDDIKQLIRVNLGYVSDNLEVEETKKKTKNKKEEEEEEEKKIPEKSSGAQKKESKKEKKEKLDRKYAKLNADDYKDSLIIFDDVDTLMNSEMSRAILSFRDFLLEQHRHFNIFLVCTTHLLLNYQATRRLLNEAQKVVVFPSSGNDAMIKNFLKRYIGWNNETVEQFFTNDISSRWKLVYKQFPNYVLSSNLCYLVN